MQSTYTDTIRITDNECDANGFMLPGSILRRVQQIGTDQCSACGITAQVYKDTQTAFLLAKLGMEILHPIALGTVVQLRTTPYAPVRAVYSRVTQLYTQDGTLLATVDARWILVNRETHRILRQTPPEICLPYLQEEPVQLPVRIVKAAETQQIGTQCATYTRCDTNHHLNNTHYADIACDCLPIAALLANPVRRMTLAYHNEIPMDTPFTLHRGITENGAYYVLGMREETKYFEVNVEL